MIRFLLIPMFAFITLCVQAQSFEVTGIEENNLKGTIGETIKHPITLKNPTDKNLIVTIRKISQVLGSTQKNYFCIENNCLDSKIEEYTVKLEPHQTISNIFIAMDAGLAQATSSVKFIVINKHSSADFLEFDLNYSIEEKEEKSIIYSSDVITLRDVYPNPVRDIAFINYTLLNDRVKAKMVIHNILGNTIEEYALPSEENKVKITVDGLNAGIYFYTLYIDNEGVITRKLIVKK